MIKTFVLLCALTVSAGAHAQLNPSSSNLSYNMKLQAASSYPLTGLRPGNSGDTTNPGRICLIEKATRRNVCHSRARWEAIAARIDAGLPPSR